MGTVSVAVRCPFCGTITEHSDVVGTNDRQTMVCPKCLATSGYDLRWSRYIGKADLAANIAPQYAQEPRKGA